VCAATYKQGASVGRGELLFHPGLAAARGRRRNPLRPVGLSWFLLRLRGPRVPEQMRARRSRKPGSAVPTNWPWSTAREANSPAGEWHIAQAPAPPPAAGQPAWSSPAAEPRNRDRARQEWTRAPRSSIQYGGLAFGPRGERRTEPEYEGRFSPRPAEQELQPEKTDRSPTAVGGSSTRRRTLSAQAEASRSTSRHRCTAARPDPQRLLVAEPEDGASLDGVRRRRIGACTLFSRGTGTRSTGVQSAELTSSVGGTAAPRCE